MGHLASGRGSGDCGGLRQGRACRLTIRVCCRGLSADGSSADCETRRKVSIFSGVRRSERARGGFRELERRRSPVHSGERRRQRRSQRWRRPLPGALHNGGAARPAGPRCCIHVLNLPPASSPLRTVQIVLLLDMHSRVEGSYLSLWVYAGADCPPSIVMHLYMFRAVAAPAGRRPLSL